MDNKEDKLPLEIIHFQAISWLTLTLCPSRWAENITELSGKCINLKWINLGDFINKTRGVHAPENLLL